MPPVLQAWIVFLTLADASAATGLWLQRSWGIAAFIVIACAQLVAYLGWPEVFGRQVELIVFHIGSLIVYVILQARLLHAPAR